MRVQDLRLEDVLDGLSSFLVVVRPDGVVLRANRTALQRLGVRRDQVLGQPLHDARWWTSSPDDLRDLRRALATAAAGGEARCVATAGPEALRLTLRPVRDDEGLVETISVEGVVTAIADDTRAATHAAEVDRLDVALRRQIRERHRAEARMELQADLLDQIEDAVLAWDRDDRVVTLNAAAASRVGIAPSAARGRRIDEVLRWRPLDPDDDRASIEAAVAIAGRWEGVVVQQLPDGREAIVEAVVRPLDHRDVRDGRVAVLRDVTVLRETEEALRRSEGRFRRALDAVGAMVYEADGHGRMIATYNLERTFGERGRVRDAATWWSSRLHPEDRRRVEVERDAAVTSGRPWRLAYRARHADGRWVHLEEHGSIVADGEAAPHRIGIVLDVTERKDAERALLASRQELATLAATLEERVTERTVQVRALSAALTLAEQRERRRLSQVLHDGLQQLLFSLGMRLQAARKQAALGDEHPADAALRYCQDLVRRSVAITRSIAVELNPPTLRGSELKPALQWLAKHVGDVHGLEVDIDVPDDLRVPGSDARALVVQVVRELLVNVARHAGTTRARLWARCQGSVLEIAVSDEGRGFDVDAARARQRAFDAFGLFTVEERIRLFGGSTHVCSQPGEGTTVTLRVPLAEADG